MSEEAPFCVTDFDMAVGMVIAKALAGMTVEVQTDDASRFAAAVTSGFQCLGKICNNSLPKLLIVEREGHLTIKTA